MNGTRDPPVPSTGVPGGALNVSATDTHPALQCYIRRDEYLSKDDPRYDPEVATIMTRKAPPLDEVPGDAFDRQRVIPDFDQLTVERQVCLVLGTGGIGQNVSLILARLGVGHIILVDKDTCDASNLTRQCLSSVEGDVGRTKVDVAADNLSGHNMRTKVTPVVADVLKDWWLVVSLAKTADVIFNGVDLGPLWDAAVSGLAKEVGVPLVVGQSYGWTYTAEFYNGEPDTRSAWDGNVTSSAFYATKSAERMRRQIFARIKDAPDFAKAMCDDPAFRLSQCDATMACFTRASERVPRPQDPDEFAVYLEGYLSEALRRITPGLVGQQADLLFLPNPKGIPTRMVGSWICPCLGCANTMVSQWVNFLTGPLPLLRDPPSYIKFDLPEGMTEEENASYHRADMFSAMRDALESMPSAEILDTVATTFLASRSARPTSTTKAAEGCLCAKAAKARMEALEERLFMGSVETTFQPVKGSVHGANGAEGWEYCRNSADAVSLREGTQGHLGDEYSNCLIPAVPAYDVAPPSQPQPASLPPVLSQPLLKKEGGAIAGVASGIRSGLVKGGGKWYRLKGCGNRYEGFPLEPLGNKGEVTPRGSSFEYATNTELFMTAKALAAVGEGANVPVGAYEYDVACPLPKIRRWCTVFETLGDRRAGDHLVGGLLRLAVVMVPPSAIPPLEEAVMKGRGSDEVWETDMVTGCGMSTADLTTFPLFERAPPGGASLGLKTFDPMVWNTAAARLRRALPREESLLLYMAWRIGWECGDVLRKLAAADISWGTYTDGLGTHCNAHINNMVVKAVWANPPDSTTFLAPLDFDMAFTREGYLQRSGGMDFDKVLEFERLMSMRQVLGGSSFASTGVQGCQLPPEYALFRTAFHDTMVAGFDCASAGMADPHPWRDDLRSPCYDLIRLALCTTADVVA